MRIADQAGIREHLPRADRRHHVVLLRHAEVEFKHYAEATADEYVELGRRLALHVNHAAGLRLAHICQPCHQVYARVGKLVELRNRLQERLNIHRCLRFG